MQSRSECAQSVTLAEDNPELASHLQVTCLVYAPLAQTLLIERWCTGEFPGEGARETE